MQGFPLTCDLPVKCITGALASAAATAEIAATRPPSIPAGCNPTPQLLLECLQLIWLP